MLTFLLQYKFLPLSMRITSCIVKKMSAFAEKVVRKRVELQATFFVCLVCSLINLRFLTNQIVETSKQIKLRWRKSTTVSWRCYQYGKQFRTVYYCCTFLPTATTTGTTTAVAAAATTTNKSTTTTALHK